MATNLKIAFPDIPFNAVSATSSDTYSTDKPLANMISGSRSAIAELATAATDETDIEFDLGSGNAQAADYIAILNAKMLKASGVTAVNLYGSNSQGSYGAAEISIDLASITLSGGQGLDYIETFTESSAYRYWLLEFDSTDATKRPVSKVYFGKLFDLGRDPIFGSSGAVSQRDSKNIYATRELQLDYRGITEAVRESFQEKILQYEDSNFIVLHTLTYDVPLLNTDLLSCRIAGAQFQSRYLSLNDLSLRLEEVF